MKNIVLTEQKIKYIQDRIPSIARNIHEGNFFKKAGLFAKELGYRALGAMERANMEKRVETDSINSKNAQRIADIQLSNAGFNVPNVKEILAIAPKTQPIIGKKPTQRQQDQHDAQMELFRQRQTLEKQLTAARQINPGLRKSETDVRDIRSNFARRQQRSATLIDPGSTNYSNLKPSDLESLLPFTKSYIQKANIMKELRKRLP
jgi:hypothetical protein